MDKPEIEQRVGNRIRQAVETAAAECVRELNASGHAFVPVPTGVLEWVDEANELVLEVNCALGINVSVTDDRPAGVDPVTAAYLALAESGEAHDASVLNALEGDIANGGFMQLLDNKGSAFIEEAIVLLRQIGAEASARVVEEALVLLEARAPVLSGYDALQCDLGRLDSRFEKLSESIPERYMQHRTGGAE